MSASQQITIVGNLVDDPELRFTPTGLAVTNIRVVVSDRKLNKATQEWEDGDPWFISCTVWRDYAEHVAESLSKGARVVVTGRITQRQYEAKDGTKRTVIDLQADEIAASMKFATVKVTKMNRTGGGGPAMASDDPWRTTSGGAATDAAGNATEFEDEPPF